MCEELQREVQRSQRVVSLIFPIPEFYGLAAAIDDSCDWERIPKLTEEYLAALENARIRITQTLALQFLPSAAFGGAFLRGTFLMTSATEVIAKLRGTRDTPSTLTISRGNSASKSRASQYVSARLGRLATDVRPMPPAKSQVTKDRYIRASNFQAKSQMLSVLSAKIKWKSRSRTQRIALILKGKRVIEGNRFEPSSAWPCTSNVATGISSVVEVAAIRHSTKWTLVF
jgi:hypothetical protein